jgi:murein DD-endopeptidase MepM/ murein hydrolase activator NlpD
MKKNFKNIIKFVFVLVLSLALVLPCVSSSPKVEASVQSELTDKQNELKKLEKLLADARKEKSELLAELKETEGKLNAFLVEKSRLETSIGYSEAEIELIGHLIEGYSSHLAELDENLKETEKLKDEKINQLCLVLKYIYENKNVSSLEMFFTSDNFSQYVSKKDNAKSILYYQQTIISEIENTESECEKAREDYEKANASLEGYKKTLEEKRISVGEEYEKLDKIIIDLENTIELQEEDYDALNAVEKEYASEIGKVKVDIEELTEYLSNQFAWPLYQSQKYYISSYFGTRKDPFGSSSKEHHNGVDIVVPKGTPILASSGGIVTRSEYASVFGNVVVISHGNGLQTLYCHCSQRLVSVGDKVKQGDVIAKVGSTGRSTAPHLHFSFILNGSYVNPNKYVPKSYFK